MKRDPFKKLLEKVRSNGVSIDENGEYTKFHSMTNKRRFAGGGGKYAGGKNTKVWNPAKVKIDANDLKKTWMKQEGKCYWLHIPLQLELVYSENCDAPYHPLVPSVDRIDENGDYTPENIVICCRLMNLGRSRYPFENMENVAKYLRGELRSFNIMDFFSNG